MGAYVEVEEHLTSFIQEWIKVKKLMEKAHHLDPQRAGYMDDD